MTRDELFTHLHETHAHKWMFGPHRNRLNSRGTGTALYLKFHAWRMEWWKDLERAFPDRIKNGVVITEVDRCKIIE